MPWEIQVSWGFRCRGYQVQGWWQGKSNAHFGVAMRSAKEAESQAYENHTSPVKIFDARLAFQVRLAAHSIRPRLLCSLTASASDLSRGLQQHAFQLLS